MKVLFGTNLDGVIWSTKEAALGEVRIGPGGLLGLLETRLGIESMRHPTCVECLTAQDSIDVGEPIPEESLQLRRGIEDFGYRRADLNRPGFPGDG